LADAEAIFRQYAQDPEVTKYVSWRAHKNIDETREYMRMCLLAWDVGKAFHWVIECAEDKQVMGMIIARVDAQKWELGYVLARKYWRGYMTEAVRTHCLGTEAAGYLPHLGGLRRGQRGVGASDGKSRYAARRRSAALVGPSEHQPGAA
jgi:hypothetical protein